MKKSLIFVLSFVLMMTIISASDVAYVSKNSNVDQVFVESLNEMNMTVDVVLDKNVKTTDFSAYKIIFVGDQRLRNVKSLPADKDYVIASHYYGEELGLTDRDGISRFAANSPLEVKKGSQVIKVYDEYRRKIGRNAIQYYYLAEGNKLDGMNQIASTYRRGNTYLGDVVSYSENRCFFGIVSTDHWTDETKMLFKECVSMLGVSGTGNQTLPPNQTDEDEQNETEENETEILIHDVAIDLDYTNTVNGIRIRDLNTSEYLTGNELICNQRYTISFRTLNIGNSTENVTMVGMFGSVLNWTSSKDNLEPGQSSTAGSKTINATYESGWYNITVKAEIESDDAPENNLVQREVRIVCPVDVSGGLIGGTV